MINKDQNNTGDKEQQKRPEETTKVMPDKEHRTIVPSGEDDENETAPVVKEMPDKDQKTITPPDEAKENDEKSYVEKSVRKDTSNPSRQIKEDE